MILVTGAAGLLGRELTGQLLAQGKKVRAIYNRTRLPDFNSSLLEQVQCDILDVEGLAIAMEGITELYHCAAIVSFAPKRKRDLFKINIEGTANVVNAAIEAGVRKMVHVSSVAALGRIREDAPINETMNWTPETSNSIYGQSKYLGELEVWRGIGEGLDAVIVNPVVILGPGDWDSGSSKLVKNVYDGFPWYSEGTTGFVDVRDVALAMIQLMKSNISRQRFILSAATTSYRFLFESIAKAFGKKAPHKKVTPFLAAIVWRLEAIKSKFTGSDPLVTKETSLTALAKVDFDNSKLKKMLPGFSYHSLEDTVGYTCHAFQHSLNKK